MSLIARAYIFMKTKHEGQKRKLSGEPYYVHPERVAGMAIEIGHSDNFVAAALLHDVVEDCEVELSTIKDIFGEYVVHLVEGMTNTSKKEYPKLNRAARKQKDHERIANCDFETKYLKFLDRYDNLRDMIKYMQEYANGKHGMSTKDFGWFWLYLHETYELLDALALKSVGPYNLKSLCGDLQQILERYNGQT